MAAYALRKVANKEELSAVASIILSLPDEQLRPLVLTMFRAPGTKGETDDQAALTFTRDFLWALHEKAPSSQWWVVEETATNNAVGCCQWRYYTAEQPFGSDGMPKLTATWCPEGEARDFISAIADQNMASRRAWMNRPHAELGWLGVVPAHRRRGVSRMLMDVGLAKADELGLGAFLEATDAGAIVYKLYGYRSLLNFHVDAPENSEPSEQWRSYEKLYLPQGLQAMWRPPRGIWDAESLKLSQHWRASFLDRPFVRGEIPDWLEAEHRGGSSLG